MAELAAALVPVPPRCWEPLAEAARHQQLLVEAAAYERQLRRARAE